VVVVSPILPVFTVIVTPVLTIILQVLPIVLPVISTCRHAIVQVRTAVLWCLWSICKTILNASPLVRQSISEAT
jgi:hypothetical protein